VPTNAKNYLKLLGQQDWLVGSINCLNFAETSGMLLTSCEKQTSVRNGVKKMNENLQRPTHRL